MRWSFYLLRKRRRPVLSRSLKSTSCCKLQAGPLWRLFSPPGGVQVDGLDQTRWTCLPSLFAYLPLLADKKTPRHCPRYDSPVSAPLPTGSADATYQIAAALSSAPGPPAAIDCRRRTPTNWRRDIKSKFNFSICARVWWRADVTRALQNNTSSTPPANSY